MSPQVLLSLQFRHCLVTWLVWELSPWPCCWISVTTSLLPASLSESEGTLGKLAIGCLLPTQVSAVQRTQQWTRAWSARSFITMQEKEHRMDRARKVLHKAELRTRKITGKHHCGHIVTLNCLSQKWDVTLILFIFFFDYQSFQRNGVRLCS